MVVTRELRVSIRHRSSVPRNVDEDRNERSLACRLRQAGPILFYHTILPWVAEGLVKTFYVVLSRYAQNGL